ncbi:MAG: hypothetical protein Q8P68_06220 [Candidatus Peregrinibacteria bacterium]|nr:hypothetical protein [Candidatus Peregrinibacteria bacterium]MDZ4245136.1 hypothetical protein [Candidatus Gracilibacteria bacterium]
MNSNTSNFPTNLSAVEIDLKASGYVPKFTYQHGDIDGMSEYSSITEALRKDRIKYKTMHVENRCTIWVTKG